MAEVIFEDVYKYFNEQCVVKNLSCSINDREFVVIVGPSGCGKSTTLRMIAGLESITDGTIRIGKRVVNDIPPKDRDIAMVFQNYALYPHMTVYKNMSFGLMLRHLPQAEIDRRVKYAAKILGIEDYLERKPKQLSGGQRQRVAVGRAIVREPSVFLFDEPLSNLDAKLRVQMRSEIKKIHQQIRATMVYVTHDQVEAMTMGDRIIILKDGILQQIGAPLELYRRPINQFVAGFIGSPAMNFIDVKLVTQSDSMSLSAKDFSFVISGQLSQTFELDKDNRAILGIRPEDLIVADTAIPERFTSFNCNVELVEAMGAETMIHASSGNQNIVARIDGSREVKSSGPIRLMFDMAKIHLFSTQTSNSLRRTDV